MAEAAAVPPPSSPSLPSSPSAAPSIEALTLLVANLDRRLAKQEAAKKKSGIKRLSENAGMVGLILGLILTVASLYDVFVRKPAAERLTTLSQFNQAVNAAVKIRQEAMQQSQTGDWNARLAALSMATPRILGEISTAKALLRNMNDDDVAIPQLLTLITESVTIGDLEGSAGFVQRAVHKKDATPYLQSEAKRYEGKLFYYTGRFDDGRESYRQSIQLLGTAPTSAASKAFVLGDLLGSKYANGDCGSIEDDVQAFADLLKTQGVSSEMRMQLGGSLMAQIAQFQGQRCPAPGNVGLLGKF